MQCVHVEREPFRRVGSMWGVESDEDEQGGKGQQEGLTRCTRTATSLSFTNTSLSGRSILCTAVKCQEKGREGGEEAGRAREPTQAHAARPIKAL